MRSVSAKIIAWAVVALLLSLAMFMFISRNVIGRSIGESMMRLNAFQFYEARTAYETAGPAGLAKYRRDLERFVGAEHYLTDASGRDLETGADRSEIVRSMEGKKHSATPVGDDRVALATKSDDGRYVWFVVVKPPFSTWTLAPFYLLVLLAVALLYWLVASRIASPLRQLAGVVDRFGQGDLTARAASPSKDEIGELGRSFNAMAERIETLLTAERQLLQDVSHELRSPLARLTFAAEMVRKTTDRDAAAARLRREIDRLSELVKTLLDMTRVEGDPASADFEEVALTELLQDIVEDCEFEAAERGCRITLDAPEGVAVRGSHELLRRAVENVVRNGVRYAPEGTAVEVALRDEDSGLAITVRDHGPGVSDELLPRIFDSFFRVDSSRDENTGGAGLGLAIAKRAMRLHGGAVSAENAHPGLRVRLALPVRAEMRVAEPTA